MLKGMRRVKEVSEKLAEERQSFGDYVPFFSLKDGETAELRFNGSDDEPHIADIHSVKRGRSFTTVTCAKGHPKHDGCVGCWATSNGDKGVSRPKPSFTFNVIDRRWVHKIEDEKRSTKERTKYMYLPCSDDKSCKHCKRKIERERSGQKRWAVSPQWAAAIAAIDEKCSKKCKSCGIGKISSLGFRNRKNKLVDVDDMDHEELEKKIEDGDLTEEIECTKCEDPVRATIRDAVVEATRVGENTATSYQFQIVSMDEMEDWEQECEPGDLATLDRPLSAEKQAEKLGIRNPMENAGSREVEEYGDEDGDEDDEDLEDEAEPFEDDEDDDDEPRKKKKSKGKVVKKKKPLLKKKKFVKKR